jgi:hypothetical protein
LCWLRLSTAASHEEAKQQQEQHDKFPFDTENSKLDQSLAGGPLP